jgi:hypothetical protein
VRGTRGILPVAFATALVLSGCTSRPPGVDGNLTNNWPAMPAAKVPVPADHACYIFSNPSPTYMNQPHVTADCTGAHNVETVMVGTLTGDDADRDSPPPPGGPGQRGAYAACDKAVRDFLGGDWRAARIALYVTLPRGQSWSGGARWFRCDLIAYDDTYHESIVAQPHRSLKGELTGTREFALGCATIKQKQDNIFEDMTETACAQPHNAEFAGVWDAPDVPYPSKDDKSWDDKMFRGCYSVIAKYVGVPDDSNMEYRSGAYAFGFGNEEWARGNRGYRCYIWTDTRQVSSSYMGAGTKGFPVH